MTDANRVRVCWTLKGVACCTTCTRGFAATCNEDKSLGFMRLASNQIFMETLLNNVDRKFLIRVTKEILQALC
jgi:D-arabinose 1-dehydrogenase-like Zn-dependent alcohol dehydrogenase